MGRLDRTIRTLIVDDHPVVRYGVKHMLEEESDITVVGELGGITGISEVISDLQPDVVLLDLELEEAQGIDALRQLRELAPGMHIIIYTSHSDEVRIVQAVELGVNGYLLKGCSKEIIVGAIRSVHEGGTALESSVASKLMTHMRNRSRKKEEPAIRLSKRERQVLELLAAGKTNRIIGTKLFISESTVKFHVHALMSKLDAHNRTEAVSIAANQGLIDFVADDSEKSRQIRMVSPVNN